MCEIINLGDGITAIVCGGPGDHECNEDGNILILSDGNRVENTPENFQLYKNSVTGGSVCCTICGHAAIDDAYKLNF